MLLFDIGANRGDATYAGLAKGYRVVALEPAPRIFAELVKNFIYDPRVTPLKFAVSDSNNQRVEFYEAVEDGLSTLNKEWLTADTMPYAGKEFRTISATTITLDRLVELYGKPDLIKVDVEGAEWSVFRGLSQPYPMCFEWTLATIEQHQEQLKYLYDLGYRKIAPQFIEHHLQEPDKWYELKPEFPLWDWIKARESSWSSEGWMRSGLRRSADVGMIWVR